VTTVAASAPTVNASDLTFGVEIECMIPADNLTAARVRVGSYHNGCPIPGLPAGWNAQSDCSIRPEAGSGLRGVEIVSPVLRGALGIAQVKQVVAWVRTQGGNVNASCGLHVHVGFGGRSANDLARLVCAAAYFEKALYAMTGTKSREQGNYSKSIKDRSFKSTGRTGKADGTPARDRYRVLNLTNLARGGKPTVEFRCFAGTLNVLKVLAAVQVCLGLVELTLNTVTKFRFDGNPATKTGQQAVSQLFSLLRWRFEKKGKPGKWRPEATAGLYRAMGMLDPETLAACGEKCLELARKYDGQDVPAADPVVVADVAE
jgi:hypothetical protein